MSQASSDCLKCHKCLLSHSPCSKALAGAYAKYGNLRVHVGVGRAAGWPCHHPFGRCLKPKFRTKCHMSHPCPNWMKWYSNNKSVFGVAVSMLAWDDGYDHMPAASIVTIVWNQLAIEKLKDNPWNSRYHSFELPKMRTTRRRKTITKNRQRAGRHVPSIKGLSGNQNRFAFHFHLHLMGCQSIPRLFPQR